MTIEEKINLLRELTGREPKIKPSKRQTMQEMHGLMPGFICKQCQHSEKYQYGKAFYKCGLWIKTNSRATDIKATQAACGKFKSKQ